MGIPLEGAGKAPPLSFLPPDADLPPLGMRLAILEPFFPPASAADSLSSLGGVLALPALLLAFSSFSLGWGSDFWPELFPEPFAVGRDVDDGGDNDDACVAGARLTGAGGARSSPYSDRSSSS